MRRTFTTVLLILVCLSVYAYDMYYTSMGSSFMVDLENNRLDGAGNGDYNAGEYHDSDMVGIFGVSSRNNDVETVAGRTFSLTFTPLDYTGNMVVAGADDYSSWMYRSLSDPTARIPYGIDLVVRYQVEGQSTNRTAGVVSLGYHSGSTSPVALFKKIGNSEDYSVTAKPNATGLTEVTITAGDGLIDGEENTAEGSGPWVAFWIDIVLTVPADVRDNLYDEGKIEYVNADDYQAAFRMDISGDGNEASNMGYSVYLNGYYGQGSSDGGAVVFSINPTGAASSIDLTGMNPGDRVTIGNYYYTTATLRDKSYVDPGLSPFKIFVSSSEDHDPATAPAEFSLRHIAASENNDSLAVNIPFSIVLTSNIDSNVSKTYLGSERSRDGDSIMMKGQYRFETSREGEDFKNVTYTDEGTIEFELGEVNKSELVRGYYTDDIYIHLSTEW